MYMKVGAQWYEVLVEKIDDTYAYGYTENYLPVRIMLPPLFPAQIRSENADFISPGSIIAVKSVRYDHETVYAMTDSENSSPDSIIV